MKSAYALAGVVVVGLASWLALSDETCTRIPPRHWLSPLEIEMKLRDGQFKLESMRTSDYRCFDVIARDAYGVRYTLTVNPADGQIVASERSSGGPAPMAGPRSAPVVMD
jgi:hypothetical protein